MTDLVKREGDEIVIRVPVSAVSNAAPYAWERQYGYEHDIRITDVDVFTKELISELRREKENGDTLIYEMLDRACINAAENGAFGLSVE